MSRSSRRVLAMLSRHEQVALAPSDPHLSRRYYLRSRWCRSSPVGEARTLASKTTTCPSQACPSVANLASYPRTRALGRSSQRRGIGGSFLELAPTHWSMTRRGMLSNLSANYTQICLNNPGSQWLMNLLATQTSLRSALRVPTTTLSTS